ncbi:ParB/RepB/Spo0J family partition protein [Streptomyces sp. NPDC126503]|uniref:ParB/RepB/Spo0J family partition protein n=1 Tax=Streptomyces sp. NPDC126503 TaxID=3155315 RepID=UPI00332C67C0
MSKAKNLGAGASFAQARPISARRAAIGAATGAPTAGVPEPTELPLGAISQNPDNPREELRDLEGLAESIREIGLVNSITVATVDAYLSERPERAGEVDEGARYIVIDGHRRLEAARLAGEPTIRVSVNNALVATDESLLEAAFVANVHRDDMNPLEQAYALQKLVEFYGSQNKAAKRLGIGQSTISSKLSILDLDPGLQADLLAGRRRLEDVRNLAKLAPEQQREKADARAEERQRRAAEGRGVSRRDTPAPETVTTGPDLSRRDNPVPRTATASPDLSRRDNPVPRTATASPDLSRRDNPGGGSAGAGAERVDLSRRDNPGPESTTAADLSRRDNPVGGAELPEPRAAAAAERAVGVGAVAPWSDGAAVMEQALAGLGDGQRSRFIHRYIELTGSTEALVADLARGLPEAGRLRLATILEETSRRLRQLP